MNYYNTVMQQAEELPENIKCPYCGAGNSPDSEFCGVCFKNLRIPAGRGAEAENREILNAEPPAGLAENISAAAHPARLWLRLILAAGLFLYYLQWCRHENYFSMLDFVNLAFHEAGHVFLGLFPRFIAMAGGTIFQLAIPAVCLAHLLRRGGNLGWQLCLFWLGENLLNISIYAGDSIRQELPLVGGSEHDWTYLLTETGLIAHTTGTAKAIFFVGSAVIFSSLFLICRDAIRGESLEVGNGS